MNKNKKQLILEYSAVFEPEETGGYSVSFPLFPGCVTFGRTFEESKNKAQEVLELWLEELADRGEEIPTSKYRPIIADVPAALPPRAKMYAPSHG